MPGPTDREFGRLEGKVDALGERFGAFETRSSAEHGETSRAIKELANAIDALESKEDQRAGFFQAGGLMKGAIAALLTYIGLLFGSGRTP